VTVATPSPENPEVCQECGQPIFLTQIGAHRVWTHGTTVGVGSYGVDCPTAAVERPDSVTHFYCPAHPYSGGDNTTHHLVNGRCAYCKKTEAELRELHGLGGSS
jgi:hypothetical protein